MLILGIDTSGRQGSVALLQKQGEQLRTLGLVPISGGQYSERLVPTIAELLTLHRLERSSIGLIAVASGPGSFTGLRIAVATTKGLAEAFAIPVVAISTLELVALGSGAQGHTIAALDAQRSEVFFGEYSITTERPDPIQTQCERVVSFAEFVTLLAARRPGTELSTSDAELAARIREAGFEPGLVLRPTAEEYARFGYRRFLAGNCADLSSLDANYLRRSDAEIFLAPRTTSAKAALPDSTPSPQPIQIRPAVESDIEQLIAIADAAGSDAHWTRQQWLDIFHSQTPRRLAWIAGSFTQDVSSKGAAADARGIGFLVAQCSDSDWELENVVVISPFRRQGVGLGLLSELLTAARAGRAARILLEVRPSNRPAVHLYHASGFQLLSSRPEYFHAPTEDALIMVRTFQN